MSITYQVFQKASSDPEKNARETFSPNAGQRSRAVIPATISKVRSHPSGAAHLSGENGLLRLLELEGYRIERLE